MGKDDHTSVTVLSSLYNDYWTNWMGNVNSDPSGIYLPSMLGKTAALANCQGANGACDDSWYISLKLCLFLMKLC